MSSTNVSLNLKLLIDTEREKVLFAEASKDVVDFLFNLLQLPLATVGCLGNLYHSVENLNDTYLQQNQVKQLLLNPRIPASSTSISALLPSTVNGAAISGLLPSTVNRPPKIPKLYMCPYRCNHNVTDERNSTCSHCLGSMYLELNYFGNTHQVADSSFSNGFGAGFVKEVVTYMVMDDLIIQPMSTISSITLLNQFNVKDVGVLKEKVVSLGMAEGLKLLKASLHSEMVLTTVFINNMGS